MDKLAHRGGGQADAVFVILDFRRNTDAHDLDPSSKGNERLIIRGKGPENPCKDRRGMALFSHEIALEMTFCNGMHPCLTIST
jgi:hypothetical protein